MTTKHPFGGVEADCGSGVYVDGACQEEGGLRVPRIGGSGSYYTVFSGVWLLLAVVLFFGAFLPTMCVAPDTVGSSMGFNLGLVPIILGGAANAVGVWFGSQTMQATGYKMWEGSSNTQQKVTISSRLFDKVLRGNYLCHTLPALGALVLLGALIGMCRTGRTNRVAILGVTMLWIMLVGGVYSALPVSRATTHASGSEHPSLNAASDAKAGDRTNAPPAMVTGEKKFDVVYNHPRPWTSLLSVFAIALLTSLGVSFLLR